MNSRVVSQHAILASFALAALGACSSEVGPDAISGHSPEFFDGETVECAACHGPDSSLDPLTAGGSGVLGKHVAHVIEAPFDCGVCHADYPDAATHRDGTLDSGGTGRPAVRFDAINPDGTWVFDETTGAGTCSATACHGPDTMNWYGTEEWELPGCVTCHRTALGDRRQVLGEEGDFSRISHHVIDYSDRTTEIVQTDDCLVCHSLEHHMTGSVALRLADTGQAIVYNPVAPSGLERFCLGCHDEDGATTSESPMSPFSNANALGSVPNQTGTRISSSWNKTTGHNTSGLTCLGTGDPATGCHGNAGKLNAHGSSNPGLLAGNMNFLIAADAAFNETDYELCFSCHAAYPGFRKEDILGVASGGNYDYELTVDPGEGPGGSPMVFGYPPFYNDGIQTRFVDSDAHFHRFTNPQYQYQLHWFHLSMYVVDDYDVWLYRGEGVAVDDCDGCHSTAPATGHKATCTACHDVHGSDTPFGMVYDELDLTHDSGDTTGYMGSSDAELESAPFGCGTAECHVNRSFDRNYVYSPTGE